MGRLRLFRQPVSPRLRPAIIGRVRQDFLATREVAERARVRTIANCLNSGEFSYRQDFWPPPGSRDLPGVLSPGIPPAYNGVLK